MATKIKDSRHVGRLSIGNLLESQGKVWNEKLESQIRKIGGSM